jgi:hypothetical protein
MVWSLSRFKKDGLGNAWASSDLPHFLRFVGILPYKEGCITSISRPTSFQPSKTEETFFSKVTFLRIAKQDGIEGSGQKYVKATDSAFKTCVSSLKSYQDYHYSSNSVYHNNVNPFLHLAAKFFLANP